MTAATNGLNGGGLGGGGPLPSGINPRLKHDMDELVANAMMERMELLRRLADPRRNLDQDCGYPPLESAVSVEMMRQLYDREAVSNRVVQVYPKESWQVTPLVYEDEDSENVTEFEQAWDALGKGLGEGKSWYKDESGSGVWEYLKRADILSGIGHFGVLLLGLDDGKDLQEPVDGLVTVNESRVSKVERDRLLDLPNLSDKERWIVTNDAWGQNKMPSATRARDSSGKDRSGREPDDAEIMRGTDEQYANKPPTLKTGPKTGGSGNGQPSLSGTDQQYFGVQFGSSEALPDEPPADVKAMKLIFLRAFDESLVQIVRYEWNVKNPRFGRPVMYRITLNDPREQHSGVGLPLATVFVHWSRVIHLADNLGSSEIFGVPRQRPVLNRLLDLRKLYGSSAEGYWQACFTGLTFSTHPQLGGDVIVDETKIKDSVENYTNSLQRFLAGVGGQWSTLAPQVSDPSAQVEVQIEAICIQLGIPVRVFKGSERGELASAQDDGAWNDRLRERQLNYMTPRIIVPFIDRLILLGVLPAPKFKEQMSEVEGGLVGGQTDEQYGTDYGPEPQSPSAAQGSDTEGKVPPGDAESTDMPTPTGKPGSPFSQGKQAGKGSKKKVVGNARRGNTQRGNTRPGRSCAGGRLILNAEGEPVGVQTESGYSVEWPDLDSLGKKDKAAVAMQMTGALAQYVSGGVEAVMPLPDFLTRIMEFTEEEAAEISAAAEKKQAEQEQQQAQLAEEHGMVPEVDGYLHPEELEAKAKGLDQGPGGVPFGGGGDGGKGGGGDKPFTPVKMKEGERLVHPETGKPIGNVANGGRDENPWLAVENDGILTDNELVEFWAGVVNYDPEQPRDEGGKWRGGGESGPTRLKSLPHLPKTEEEALALATAARDFTVGLDDDDKAEVGQCIDAAISLASIHPDIEIWRGIYPGNWEEGGEHKIVKAGNFFIDVTADQFGSDPIKVFKPSDREKDYWQYEGFERDTRFEYSHRDQINKPHTGLVRGLAEFEGSDPMLATNYDPDQERDVQGRWKVGSPEHMKHEIGKVAHLSHEDAATQLRGQYPGMTAIAVKFFRDSMARKAVPAPVPVPVAPKHATPHAEIASVLPRIAGDHNQADLAELKAAVPTMPLATFHATLLDLWRSGAVGLETAEGRGGVSPAQQAAMLHHAGERLGYAHVADRAALAALVTPSLTAATPFTKADGMTILNRAVEPPATVNLRGEIDKLLGD